MERVISMPWVKKVEERSDVDLVKRAVKGDANAFSELMKRHKAYFYRMAYSYVKNEQQALDLVQETTYQGLINIHQLTHPDYFKTWMTKILIHLAIKEVQKNHKVLLMEEGIEIEAKKRMISIEDRLDLYDAIDLLRPEYKSVIILKYFNDYTIEDISKMMALSSNTVKSHLKRAKVELGQYLKGGIENESLS